MSLGLSAYDSSNSEEEEEKPVVKQKVKIFVPHTTHSSDEESEPPTKKVNIGTEVNKSSGLFAKLPPPRNTIGDGKQNNRSFVPYVFSRKNETKPVKKPKQEAAESSDEEGDVNFFSFVDKQAAETEADKDTSTDVPGSSEIAASPTPAPSVTASAYQTPETTPQDPSTIPLYTSTIPAPPSTNQLPQHTNNGGQLGMASNTIGNSWQQDERFQRLQGKKNRNEKIEFIDVNADSALEGNKELLLQQISEEKNLNRMSHSKKNSNNPSSQSKRKHQLSYLIHQAKEREIELKNAWASGYAARDAARKRYGF